MTHHHQYREGLLERLRAWRMANPDGTLGDARSDIRKKLSEAEIDLLFDNWLNSNFDRVEVKELRSGSFTAVVRPRHSITPDQKQRDAIAANRMITQLKSNLYEGFALRIWDTPLPSGVVLRDATGKDMKHASGWFGELGKKMKPTEKVVKKFSTRQLFDLSQREVFAGAS